jgi:hypothetical protein
MPFLSIDSRLLTSKAEAGIDTEITSVSICCVAAPPEALSLRSLFGGREGGCSGTRTEVTAFAQQEKTRRLFDTGRDILRAQRATKLRRAAAPSGAAGAAWRRAAPP